MLPPSLLAASEDLVRIPYGAGTSSSEVATVDDVIAGAALLRREACARAAALRSGSASADESEQEAEESEDEQQQWLSLRVRRPAAAEVAGSIGGKLWDASLLMSAWLLENPSLLQPAGCRTPRVLEIGAGLGLVGLAVARALPDARITMSDYDPAVLRNLGESIRLNFAGAAPAAPAAALVDFRDFCEADVAALPHLPPASPLCRYEGLLGSFDVVIGSDIVYDHSHARIAALLRAMLRPAANGSADSHPCALFVLPDGRPRQADFVASLGAAGLRCRIERVGRDCLMCRRIAREHEGWGADASFSVYKVHRAAQQS